MRSLLALLALTGVLFSGIHVSSAPQEEYERGTFSIYFMDEKVGYEEFAWRRDVSGMVLSVVGRITKPIQMSIEELVIRMNPSFIPTAFRFKGSVGGVAQDIESELQDGEAWNIIRVAGQEQTIRVQIRRDTFLLPNPIFSPYMAITKKFGCSLEEALELSAYVIPQVETQFTLNPKENEPCTLIMEMGATQVELITDENGQLHGLSIPLQHLRIVRE